MNQQYSLGWQPELPDVRDFDVLEHPEFLAYLTRGRPLLRDAHVARFPLEALPIAVDLRKYCSPIEDQGSLGSCTAQAGVGLVEYLERRALSRHVDGSRLFVYKATRNLLGWTGDTGAYVRTTLQALAKFGVCPERYWPYDIATFDDDPPAFCWAHAAQARTLRYFRLDSFRRRRPELLELIKSMATMGMPSIFGFTVYNFGDDGGNFPMPEPGDRVYGGHAVMCVGFHDAHKVGDSKGALRIRNSWGKEWGEDGYGWLPYEYVLRGLTLDWWTIFAQDYIGD
jgi:C1A family cysteine protease